MLPSLIKAIDVIRDTQLKCITQVFNCANFITGEQIKCIAGIDNRSIGGVIGEGFIVADLFNKALIKNINIIIALRYG